MKRFQTIDYPYGRLAQKMDASQRAVKADFGKALDSLRVFYTQPSDASANRAHLELSRIEKNTLIRATLYMLLTVKNR